MASAVSCSCVFDDFCSPDGAAGEWHCCAGTAKAKETRPQLEQRADESASASEPAEPAVPESALHAAAKAGDAEKVAHS